MKQVAKRQDPFTHEDLAALFAAAETHTAVRRRKMAIPFRRLIVWVGMAAGSTNETAGSVPALASAATCVTGCWCDDAGMR